MNDFGEDGGPAAKEWAAKLVTVEKFLASTFGKGALNIDVHFQYVWFALCFPSYFRIVFQFFLSVHVWRCYLQTRHFVAACIVLKGLGGLLFVFGSSTGAYLLVSFCHQLSHNIWPLSFHLLRKFETWNFVHLTFILLL